MTTDHLRQSVETMDRRAAILRVIPSSMSTEVSRDELAALLDVADLARKAQKHINPQAIDGEKCMTHPLRECYLNSLMAKALAKLDEVSHGT